MSCYGCACGHCLYNAELEAWYFTPGELQNVEDICYCCDECRRYDGDYTKKSQWRPECEKRKLPRKYIEVQERAEARRKRREDRRAEAVRATFTVIKGGAGRNQSSEE